MPFTLAHPALILPILKNKKLAASALIVGTMSPDFEYFFRMRMQSEISHTFMGIFLIDFPLGFLVLFAFYQIIKNPFIENCPPFLQKRLQGLKELNWLEYFKSNLITVFVSFFLGSLTHLLWDSMTHWDGFTVEHFPYLKNNFYGIPCYTIAQYVSSIVGLLAIVIYIYKLPEEKTETKKISLKYWILTFFLAFVLITIRFVLGKDLNQMGNVIVSVLTPIFISVTLSSLIFGLKK